MLPALTFHADGYNPASRQRPHQHDELHLSMVLSGRVAETVGRVTESALPFSVVAKDAGVRHANDFGRDGARMARLTLMEGTIASLVEDPCRATAWRWRHDPGASRPYVRLIQRAAGAGRTFAADDPDVLDLLAAITSRPVSPKGGEPPAWLAETMARLREEWHANLTVGDVAAQAGVHPVYLARCVRRWYGTSVGDELRRLRVQSAAHAALQCDRTLSYVAHAHGFADQAHMCREFQRVAGTTAAGYRAVVGSLDYTWRGRP